MKYKFSVRMGTNRNGSNTRAPNQFGLVWALKNSKKKIGSIFRMSQYPKKIRVLEPSGNIRSGLGTVVECVKMYQRMHKEKTKTKIEQQINRQ